MYRRRGRIASLFGLLVVLVSGAPAADGASDGRTGTFVSLTYNVAGLPEPLSGSEPATNSPIISSLLDPYDIVLLQENWQDHLDRERKAGLIGDEVPPTMYHHLVVRHADHPHRSVPKPHPYGVDPSRAPTGPPTISDGLNRLSRFPFDDVTPDIEMGDVDHVAWRSCHGEVHFTVVEEGLGATGSDEVLDDSGLGAVNHETDGGAADCGAQKGFSVARTEIAPGVVIDVYNLHADAGSHPRDIAARADNFAQLADFILEHSEGRAVVLGGDTNLKIDRPDRQTDAEVWSGFLAITGLTDVCDAVACGADDAVIDKFAFRSASDVRLVALDHTFERQRFTRYDGEPLADHDPLAVRFRWILTGRV